jgi:hypothetical protein
MVVDDVIAAFRNHKRLSLEVCTSELIKKRRYLLDAVLRPGKRMMPGNSPNDVVRHHGLYGSHIFARVCGKKRLDLVEITHSGILTDGRIELLEIATLARALASARAMALPRPLLPSVTRAVRLKRSKSVIDIESTQGNFLPRLEQHHIDVLDELALQGGDMLQGRLTSLRA